MELRDWAIHILSATTIEDKLYNPEELTDNIQMPPIIWKEPSRPPGMEFRKHSRKEKLPSLKDLQCKDKRATCLHRFAGHELLAVEIMAFTLLAFPEASKSFRKGLAHTLKDEQRHVRLYIESMKKLGLNFGDLPLYRHFWKHTPFIKSPLNYICTMSLTFEMANLDFAPAYGNAFLECGDPDSAHLMATIFRDEIAHVKFGWNWLQRLKDKNQKEWETWTKNMSTLLSPNRAKGFSFQTKPRQLAGISDEFIECLKNSS